MRHAPDASSMRVNHAAPGAALPSFAGTVCGFWAGLLEKMIRLYEEEVAGSSLETIRRQVEKALAWRGMAVYAEEAGMAGRMAGIAPDGSLLLDTHGGCLRVDSGSIRRVI